MRRECEWHAHDARFGDEVSSHVPAKVAGAPSSDTSQQERSQLSQELQISMVRTVVIIADALDGHGRRQPAALDLQHTGA